MKKAINKTERSTMGTTERQAKIMFTSVDTPVPSNPHNPLLAEARKVIEWGTYEDALRELDHAFDGFRDEEDFINEEAHAREVLTRLARLERTEPEAEPTSARDRIRQTFDNLVAAEESRKPTSARDRIRRTFEKAVADATAESANTTSGQNGADL